MAKQVGAPVGNKNAANGSEFRNRLRINLKKHQDEGRGIKRGKAIDAVCQTLINTAVDGNQQAIQEISNRLDGRPAQALEISGEVKHSFTDVLAAFWHQRLEKQVQHEPELIEHDPQTEYQALTADTSKADVP